MDEATIATKISREDIPCMIENLGCLKLIDSKLANGVSNLLETTTVPCPSLPSLSNSDEESEFPPLPAILSPPASFLISHDDDSLPPIPPFLLPSVLENDDDDNKPPKEDELEFPLPPTPECLSLIRSSTSDQVQSSDDLCCNKIESDTNPSSILKGLNGVFMTPGGGPSSYFDLVCSVKEVPTLKSELTSNNLREADPLKTINKISRDQRICSQDKSGESGSQEKDALTKISTNVLIDSGISSDFENIGSPKDRDASSNFVDDVFVHDQDLLLSSYIIPPPIFGGFGAFEETRETVETAETADDSLKSESELKTINAISIAREQPEQLAKNTTVNSIIKDYLYEINSSKIAGNAIKDTPPKTVAKKPLMSNALLPRSNRGVSKSVCQTDVSKPSGGKVSFSDTLSELENLKNSAGGIKNSLRSSDNWIGYGTCQTSKRFVTDVQNIKNLGELASESKELPEQLLTDNSHVTLNDETKKMEIKETTRSVPEKVKPLAPTKLFKLVKNPRVHGFTEEQIKATIQAKTSDSNPSSASDYKLASGLCKYNDENVSNKKVISSVENGIYGLSKDPNVKRFPDKQISIDNQVRQVQSKDAIMVQNSSSVTIQKNNSNRNRYITQESDHKLTRNIVTNGEGISAEKSETATFRNIRETMTFFEDPTERSPKNVNIKRSKSTAAFHTKPLNKNVVHESKASYHKECPEERPSVDNGIIVEDKALKPDESINDKAKIVPVSKAKAFFESIKVDNGQGKPLKTLPERAASFSTNKSTTFHRLKERSSKTECQNGVNENEIAGLTNLSIFCGSEKQLESCNEESKMANSEITDILVDGTPHLPVENLVSKFGTLKKTLTNKCPIQGHVPPERSTKLPGKTLISASIESTKTSNNGATDT